MRSESEAASILCDFEERHALFQVQVLGVSVWRLLRSQISLVLQDLPLAKPRVVHGDLAASGLRSLLGFTNVPADFDYAVRTYSSALRVRKGTQYKDVLFGPVLDEVAGGVRLTSTNSQGFLARKCDSDSPNVDCTSLAVLSGLLARAVPVSNDGGAFSAIGALIARGLGLHSFNESRVRRIFSSFYWNSVFWTRLLKKLRVPVVLAADSGEYAMIHACNRLNIRFLEMQHGVFNRNHPDALPIAALTRCSPESLLLPHAIGVYGPYWKTALLTTAVFSQSSVVPVGNPLIEHFRLLREQTFRPSANNPHIVVTTQGLDRHALALFLRDFLALYKNPCNLTIKLHPAYDGDDTIYRKALSQDLRVSIVSGTQDPNTFELLSQADIHASIGSFCHYDSIGIGTPTMVMGLSGCSTVSNLLDAGHALFAASPQQMAEIVSMKSWCEASSAIRNQYFTPNSIHHLRALIKSDGYSYR